MITITKSLLSINLYELSTNLIYSLKNKRNDKNSIFLDGTLPKYCINKDGKLLDSEIYHQYTGLIEEENNEKFLFLDINEDEKSELHYQIYETGVDSFFSSFNFNEIFKDIIKMNDDYIIKHMFIQKTYFIIETKHISYQDHFDYDYDYETKIIGYLDKYFNKIIF